MKMYKRFLCVLLSTLLIFSFPISCFAEAEETEEEPAYGYRHVDFKVDAPEEDEVPRLQAGSKLPAQYSSVEANPKRSTLVKNQGSHGTCWAFSALSAAEGTLTCNYHSEPEWDLSELQLAYFFYHEKIDPLGNANGDKTEYVSDPEENNDDGILDYGGNNAYTMWALASWTGSANESELPYEEPFLAMASDSDISDSYILTPAAAHLQNAFIIPNGTDASSINRIKKAVVDYGTVATSYYDDDDYYNGFPYYAYYCPEAKGGNHAVSIVGWDDDFAINKFKSGSRPDKPGAWLIKNSWGTSRRDNGYFWMSYYDASLQYDNDVFIFDYSPADTYDFNYQYDGSCGLDTYTVKRGSEIAAIYIATGAAVSDSDKYERIDAVGMGFYSTNVSGTISIYKDVQNDNPKSGTAIVTNKKFNTSYAGYYTFPIENGPTLSSGAAFSVVIKFDKSCQIFTDSTYATSWIKFKNDTQNDKTYYIADGDIKNFKNILSGRTARLKAYTKMVDAEAQITTPAGIDSFNITYHANGGYGAPSMDTKLSGAAIYISTGIPQRSGYNFIGWATTSNGEAEYFGGEQYTANAALDLYAIWERQSSPSPAPDFGGGSGVAAAVVGGVVGAIAIGAAVTIPVLLFLGAMRMFIH